MNRTDLLLTKINKAFDYAKIGLSGKAEQEFLRALDMAKEKSVVRDICYQLAVCCIDLKKYDDAKGYLYKAIKNCKTNEMEALRDIKILLVTVYKLQNDINSLKDIYTEISKYGKSFGEIYIDAVTYTLLTYLEEKKYDEGLKLVKEALNGNNENTDLFLLKIKFLSLKDDHENALTDGLDYVRRFGYNHDVYLILGRAYALFMLTSEAYDYILAVYKTLPLENDEQRRLDSLSYELMNVMLSSWPYHEKCDKDFLKDLLKRKYEISALFEKNIDFITKLGFFKKLKIGYLSPDLYQHPVGEFIMPVMENHNPCHSINACYSVTDPAKLSNPYSDYLINHTGEWHNLYGKSDDELEEFILAESPDIMLELSSISKESKLDLYTRRLAPLQVSWIGFPVSSGVKAVDYVLTDKYADPPGIADEYYTEKLLYMPDTFLCHMPSYNNALGEAPPSVKNGYITFGCFNNCNKITDRMLINWHRILACVKDSRLLLKSGFYDNSKTLDLIKERMVRLGFNMESVEFEGASTFGAYLDRYNDVDILLDTYPFNGATTTFDAFFMGTPLVALIGETHPSRVSLGMLTNVGLEDLAVYTDGDYVNAATALAGNAERLFNIKRTLRDVKMNSKLSDFNAFRQEYEYAMRRIWIEYCKKTRKHPVYGGLELNELADSLVNGACYICKLISDAENEEPEDEVLNEYINLQRVFIRKLDRLWAQDDQKAKSLDTGQKIANVVFDIKNLSNENKTKILNANIKYVLSFVRGEL